MISWFMSIHLLWQSIPSAYHRPILSHALGAALDPAVIPNAAFVFVVQFDLEPPTPGCKASELEEVAEITGGRGAGCFSAFGLDKL
jgi:hypothetical protein